MNVKSELNALVSEYKKVRGLNNIANNVVSHSDEFRNWLSETIMDAMNYEKLIAEILNSKYEVIGEVMEVGSKPVLSCSEFITSENLSSINYSNFVGDNGSSDLGSNRVYQRNMHYLEKDIKNTKLLLMQSYESENMNVQRCKLTRVNSLSINHSIPFMIGCYGHQSSRFFKQKEQLLLEFINTLVDQNFDFYADSYNNVACRIIVPNKSKTLVKTYRKY
ncbi:MAG: hypothetical protein V8Q75_03975 [Bacilli bacterium]